MGSPVKLNKQENHPVRSSLMLCDQSREAVRLYKINRPARHSMYVHATLMQGDL